MEVTRTAKLVTDFYGSAPAVGAKEILRVWAEDKAADSLLTFAQQEQKKGEEIDQALERILSICHRTSEGFPMLGNWMLRRCFVMTGLAIFNAQKDKTHPKKDVIPMAVSLVEPREITFTNGNGPIRKPDGVATCTVTITKPQKRSFFKAYEYIKAGSIFGFTAWFDDDLMTEEQIELLLRKSGQIGVGAFRERYGKFEILPN